MKIIAVLVGNINKFPPTVSLMRVLGDLGIQTVLITTETDYKADKANVVVDKINLDYEKKSPIQKLALIPRLRHILWEKIKRHYNDDAVIWVVTDVTVKYLGYRLIGKRYVLQFLELSDKLVYYKKIPWISLDEKKLCNNALQIIVPEYNRAHILKALWNINKLPLVLPNCPYFSDNVTRNMAVEDKAAKEILQKIGNRKIILYQGILGAERPLEPFIAAADRLGDKYAFVIMSGGKNKYSDIETSNFFFIPFVAPPKHLQITSHAYIGVLSYVPARGTGYSVLNTLYCAPNKTYEFSMFGVPMIGNDNPGLKFLFSGNGVGEIFESWTETAICEAIMRIEENYSAYSEKAKKYYKSTDVKEIVNQIIKTFEE